MGCVNSCFDIKPNKKLILPNNDTLTPQISKLKTSTQKLSYGSYLYSFDSNKLEYCHPDITVEFSGFGFKGIIEAYDIIREKYIGSNYAYYVVCPVYYDKKGGKILDTQFSITGTCHINEIDMFAVTREITEEIGITICNKNSMQSIINISDQNRSVKTYFVDITNERAFDSKIDEIYSGKDDKSKKIQVVVIGEINSLKKIYSNVRDRPLSDDLASIRYVRFISIKEFF